MFDTLAHPFRRDHADASRLSHPALRVAGVLALAIALFSLLYCFVQALD